MRRLIQRPGTDPDAPGRGGATASEPGNAPSSRAPRVLEDVAVVVRDGTRLSARVWLPDETPAPAILEVNPYRKDDATLERDAGRHPAFAGAGYVSVRLDLRGSGASDGSFRD